MLSRLRKEILFLVVFPASERGLWKRRVLRDGLNLTLFCFCQVPVSGVTPWFWVFHATGNKKQANSMSLWEKSCQAYTKITCKQNKCHWVSYAVSSHLSVSECHPWNHGARSISSRWANVGTARTRTHIETKENIHTHTLLVFSLWGKAYSAKTCICPIILQSQ